MEMRWVRPSGQDNDPFLTSKGLIKVRRLVHAGNQRQIYAFAFIVLDGKGMFNVRVGTPGPWDVQDRKYTAVGDYPTLEEAQAVAVATYLTQ